MKKLTAILTSAFMLTASIPFVPVNYAVAAETSETESASETYTITLSDSGISTNAGEDVATISNNSITIIKPAAPAAISTQTGTRM